MFKKLITIISIAACFSIAAIAQQASQPKFHCVGTDLTNTVVAKFPDASNSVEVRKVWVEQNKEALLEVFKSLDLSKNPLWKVNNGVVVGSIGNDTNIDSNTSACLWLLIITIRENDTDFNKKLINLLGDTNYLYFGSNIYDRSNLTLEAYQELKANDWKSDMFNGAKIGVNRWISMANVKGDVEFLKDKIADGTIPTDLVLQNPWLKKYCSKKALYNFLRNKSTLTVAEEKEKNRLFTDLYQAKLLGETNL